MISINKNIENKKPYIIPKSENGYINLSVIQNNIKHRFTTDNINMYPSVDDNYNSLITEISKYNKCNSDNILLTNGSGAGLQLILKTFCNQNTNILIPVPNYPGFVHDAEIASSNVTLYNCTNINKYFIKEINNNKIIYISSPNIPLGYSINKSFLKIIKLHPDKIFIIDEAYIEYSNSIGSFTNELDNLIITRTFSKAFGAAGIRLGYILANKNIMQKLLICYCTKSIPDFSINYGLSIMKDVEYYLYSVKNDLNLWNKKINEIKFIISNSLQNKQIIDIEYSYQAPFCLLICKNAEYVTNIMKSNGILVRNKTIDIGKECIRICLSDNTTIDKIINIIIKLNFINIKLYSDIYLDLDKTLRTDYISNIDKELINIINKLSLTHKIKCITNNRENYKSLENYLSCQGLKNYELITPLKLNNIILSINDISNGYSILNDGVFIFKFPKISYNLLKIINYTKKVYIIENNNWEDSIELGEVGENIKIPFIGSFIKLLDTDISIKTIGKQSIKIIPCDGIMIGDSQDDYAFSYNNNLYYYNVNNPTETLLFLKSLI